MSSTSKLKLAMCVLLSLHALRANSEQYDCYESVLGGQLSHSVYKQKDGSWKAYTHGNKIWWDVYRFVEKDRIFFRGKQSGLVLQIAPDGTSWLYPKHEPDSDINLECLYFE